MTKKEQLSKVGNIEQLAYVRELYYAKGRAKGMSVLDVKSGALGFQVGLDKCMDIISLTYNGESLHFLSKGGVQGRQAYDTNGEEAICSIMGGMFFTCGMDNVGPALETDGKGFAMHGRFRATPAVHVCSDAFWEGNSYKIRLSGEMRQGVLFGENIVLRRTIETVLGSNTIQIVDEIENEGFVEMPCMLLYHFNVGYPLLDEGAEVIIPSKQVRLREEQNKTTLPWQKVSKPVDGCLEEVFYHTFDTSAEDLSAEVYNADKKLGFIIKFKRSQLPFLTQWKSMASGDYVMGLEPCNCHVEGILQEEQKYKTLEMLPPFGKKKVELEICIRN